MPIVHHYFSHKFILFFSNTFIHVYTIIFYRIIFFVKHSIPKSIKKRSIYLFFGNPFKDFNGFTLDYKI